MKRLATLIMSGAIALFGGRSQAQDIGDLEGLLGESVVSTASKAPELASSAPAQVLSITAEQMHAFGIRTVDEALNFLGVAVHAQRIQDSLQYYGTTEEVGTRGVMFRDGGSRILVLLDGHTTNSQIDGSSYLDGQLGVPLELIDHVEVVIGPGSVVYGTSAFLAVVNVVTKRARDLRGLRGTASVTLQPPMGDDRNLTGVGNGDSLGAMYRLSLSVGHEFTLFKRPAEIVAQAEWVVGSSGSFRVGPQYGSYPLGVFPLGDGAWRATVSSPVNAPALVATLRVGDWRLQVHVNSYDRGAPFTGMVGAPVNNVTTRHLGIDLRNTTAIGRHFTLTSRLYLDASEAVLKTAVPSISSEFPDGETFVDRKLSQWIGLEEQGVVDWLLDGRLITTVGFDVRGRRSQAVLGHEEDPQTGRPSQLAPVGIVDDIGALGGIFVQQTYQPLKWLGLNAGLRVDLDQLFGVHASPRAAVVLTPFKNNTIKLMYAEAFRAPTPLESFEAIPFVRLRPASSLRPEVLRSVELELSQRWSSGRAVLNGFVSFYDDMIDDRVPTGAEYNAALASGAASTIVPASGYQVLDNMETIRAWGGSLTVEQRFRRGLSGGFSAMLSRTELHDKDNDTVSIELTPSWLASAHVLWQPHPDGFSLGAAVQLLGARLPYLSSYAPPAAIVQAPSADVRLTATVPIPLVRGLSTRFIADYNTDGRAPIQVGGPSSQAPNAAAELLPLPRAFFMAEVHYEH
ncbi:MAG TPA: TonB-dependent receptor [Polyangia bacterium]|nr:TonB-dependent receptor [Polyangia bacterium]